MRWKLFAQQRSKQRVDYRYRIQGYDVCDLHTALTRLRDGHVYQRGRYPTCRVERRCIRVACPVNWRSSWLRVRSSHARHASRPVAPCLLATPRGYVPVFDFNVRVGALPYRVAHRWLRGAGYPAAVL